MRIVLDTNVVLDCFVFRDEAARALREAIEARRVQWLATAAMREELACVLAYPQVARWLQATSAGEVLAAFDVHAQLVDEAAACAVSCRDADDQKFIDLAHAHSAMLLSKDAQVLALRRKLEPLGVAVAKAWTGQ